MNEDKKVVHYRILLSTQIACTFELSLLVFTKFSRFSSQRMPWRKFFNQQSRAVRHKFPGKSININASMFYNFSK